MALIVGLDTGGTYTDGVLFDPEKGVLAKGKALTTKHDLSIGLERALDHVLPAAGAGIDLVCISTTLATNAVVEGHGSPAGLLMVGFDERVLGRAGLRRALGSDPVAYLAGGHDAFGEAREPLDLDAARAAIERMARRVEGFAIAGLFAVRNPEHESALRELVRETTGLPATCSHELSSKLDAPRRALTTLLNARLIPQLRHLTEAVFSILARKRIAAPLMVVRGDGSLEDAQVALHRPVETILSGPAASLVGAHHLSGEDDAIVIDMGGTTTDIALLHDGVPVIDETGASVGGWNTMVEAVSIHTYGLGGDSEVHVAPDGEIRVGPRRCVPLSLLVHQHPKLLVALEAQANGTPLLHSGRFVMRLRSLASGAELPRGQRRVWDLLAEGPVPMSALQDRGLAGPSLEALVDRGLVILSGFTPSDASHVLGRQTEWSTQAARVGARIWLGRQSSGLRCQGPEELAQRVLERVTRQSSRAVIESLIAESGGPRLDAGGPLGRALVDWFVNPQESAQRLLRPSFAIDRPLVAIGAPVATYHPAVARRLGVRLVIPEHADVANAVGAAAAGIMEVVGILVSAPDERTYRVHLAGGIQDFARLEDAYALASRSARELARERALLAGAVDVVVTDHRREKTFHSEIGTEIFLEAIVTAKAVGRPRLGERRARVAAG